MFLKKKIYDKVDLGEWKGGVSNILCWISWQIVSLNILEFEWFEK